MIATNIKSLYQFILSSKSTLDKLKFSDGKVVIKNVKNTILAECEPDIDSIINQLSEEILVKIVQTIESEENSLFIVVG